jgi:tetratricopeptide (TPR) repeat protein
MSPDDPQNDGARPGGETPPFLAALGERFEGIAARLREANGEEARNVVKREIIDFFRDVDGLYEQVGELRGRIRSLVEAYRGRPPAAGAAARRPSMHSDGLNSSSFVERGWNFIASEKNEEAVEALEKALALSPENLEAEGLLGWALMKAGRTDRALQSLQRVLQADPANEMARANLGYICLQRKIYGEAMAHLSGALDSGRDRKATLYALYYLGLLHAERGDPEEAVSCLRAAVEAGPNLIEAYYHMGFVLYRQQKVEQARAVWESAVARNPYNLYSKRSKAALDQLEAGRPVEEH